MATKTAVGVTLQDSRLFRQASYIDGAWIEPSAQGAIDVDNPATAETIGTVRRLGRAETRQAIEAAERAFPAWRKKTAKERAAIMRRWFDLMMANQEDLARLMTTEQGKPLTESKGEVAYAASFLEWFGEEAKRIYGDTIPSHQPDKRLVVTKEPIGVVACITPWNFPLAMITRKAGPAIAAGCTVVLKPASQTPFSALALAELAERAGMPKGVYDTFATKLADAVKKLKPANGLETGATQGPLIDDRAVEKVESHISDATSKGATVLVGGKRHALGGRFFEPTVLTNVTPAMAIAHEETFGPVAPLFHFKSEADAIALANDTEFGLASYFYGRDIGRIWRVAEALEYGIVGINTGLISTEVAPFGGVKESGIGREGSKYGIEEFLEIKYLCIGGI